VLRSADIVWHAFQGRALSDCAAPPVLDNHTHRQGVVVYIREYADDGVYSLGPRHDAGSSGVGCWCMWQSPPHRCGAIRPECRVAAY
jgi:hypothetical protein